MEKTADFRTIEPDLLKEFAQGNPNMPRVYYDKSPLVRNLYWTRLKKLIEQAKTANPAGRIAVDFGTGPGILLPSLSDQFEKVYGVDLHIADAQKLCDFFHLKAVTLLEADGNKLPLEDNSVDFVFAASVLEHFQEVEPAAKEIKRVLKPGGIIATSTPTENTIYQIGRKIFGYVKPHDHYQTARTVRHCLEKHFSKVNISRGPVDLPYEMSVYEIFIGRAE